MSSSPINLLLITKMFEEDNYQLVDYQSQQYEKNTFEIKSSGIIYEQMNQIYFSKIDNNEELEPYELFTIKLTNNEYILNIKNNFFATKPVSSSNSRFAQSSGLSPFSIIPAGISKE